VSITDEPCPCISTRAAIELATTIGFSSLTNFLKSSKKPLSATKSGLILYNFATQTAAVLRTYESVSFKAYQSEFVKLRVEVPEAPVAKDRTSTQLSVELVYIPWYAQQVL